MAQVVLREFLLAVERPKQPLDDAIQTFAQALAPSSDADDAKQQQQQQELLATKFLEIHPRGDLFFHVWPDQHGAGTRWERRESIAVFFRVLTLLLRVQSQRNANAAEVIALKVIREKNTNLEKVLTWSDKPIIEYEALELMTVLVGINGAVAREFVRLFNFQSASFAKLAARRMKKPEAVAAAAADAEELQVVQQQQKPSFQIREAYVRLVLALTACADKSVHRFAMKEGGLTASLFKSIDGDSVEMLSHLFSQLKELVLHNPSVEDKAKLVIFNGHCVHQVLPLLQSEEESIAQMALDVLTALFFDDRALYVVPEKHALRLFLSKATATVAAGSDEPSHTSEQAYAVKVIRNAIVTIGVNEYIRSSYAQALIASFITKYPGLLAEYLQAISIQLEPKPVYRWFCVASLVQKLLSCSLDATKSGFPKDSASSELPSWCSSSALASRLIMPINSRKELSRGIQHANNLIIYSSLGIMEVTLRRYQFLVSLAQDTPALSPADLENELRFLLPSPEALVSLLLKLCASVDKAGLIYVRALVVFRLYLECLPQVMSEVKLDFTKLLAWSHLNSQSTSAAAPSTSGLRSLVVSEILRFLLIVDANRLHVLLPSGASTSNSNVRSKLLQLLNLYVQTSNKAVQTLCGQVLRRTLLMSTVFGTDSGVRNGRSGEQIGFWLDSLRFGGDKCAAFMERLVQNVLADPFQYLETYHSRSGSSAGQALSLSPGTIALASFFNAPSSETGSDTLSAHRSNPEVVVFGTRILLSLLCTAEAPQQLVALITSSSGEEHDADATEHAAAKKRKRVGEAHANGHVDAYAHLVHYCRLKSQRPSKSQPAQKKAKASHGQKHAKWSYAQSSRAFAAQLLSVTPAAFVDEWEQIVENAIKVTGSFELVFHYLGSWVGNNLLDVCSPATSNSAQQKKNQSKVGRVGQRFQAELPLHILFQSVLLSNIDNDEQSTGAAHANVAKLFGILKQRMDGGSCEVTEAVHLCEQLLFALSYRSGGNGKEASTGAEDLCNLLLHVLSFVVVSAKSMASDDLVGLQIERIFRKLHAIVDAAVSKEGGVKSSLGNKLSALEISGLRLFQSEGASSFVESLFGALLERSGIPSVVLLSSLIPAELRIRLLHTFMASMSSSSAFSTTSVQDVLLQHLLKSLDEESAKTYESFAEYKKNKLLARKLWTHLERTGSSDGRRGFSFFSSGFSVLGKLGGIEAEVAHTSISSTLVPIIVDAASDTSSSSSSSEMLRRIMLAIRSDGLTSASLQPISTFSLTLESVLAKTLPSLPSDKTVSLLSAVYSVFTRIESPDLLAYARTLVPDNLAKLIAGEKENKSSTAQSLRLSFLRHAIFESDDSSSDVSEVAATVFKTLAKRFPDGKILSTTQQVSLLLMMRSSDDAVDRLSSKEKEAAVVFLVKCAIQALKSLSKSSDPDAESIAETDRVLSATSTIVEDLMRSVKNPTAILKTLGPQFARVQDYHYDSVASYMGFVKLSAVFVEIATIDVAKAHGMSLYNFADHLNAITEHPLFTKCLEAKEGHEEEEREASRLVLIRVVYWLVQVSGVYNRKLFKVLLGVYTMSLRPIDRVLRVLFEKFDENAGISLAQFGFRFGSSSTTILSAADDAVEPGQSSRADLVDDSVWLISGGLEQHRIRATIEHFPLDREVATSGDLSLLSFACDPSTGEEEVAEKKHAAGDRLLVYDPAFLLPMLSHFISSSDLPDAAIVQQGLLGVAIRATSSNADCIREYAYGIVAHMHESLTSESSDFKAGRQVHLMLESFRSAIQEPLEAVSSVITVFLNDTISILCRPVHAMYPHLNHFLLARPAIDVNDVPMFYSLFNSRAPLTYKQERSWFLHTLRRGVREDVDVLLLVRRHVLPILMSFFSSELADDHTQVLIGQILTSCLRTESGGAYLISKAAFFEWLGALVLKQQASSSSSSLADKKSLLLVMELFESALKANNVRGAELDGAQQNALALQTVNAFAALCSAIHAMARRNAVVDTKLAQISELVVRNAQSACSLATIREIIDAVSSRALVVQDGVEEQQEGERITWKRGDKIAAALACMDAIISEQLLQHPDLHKRSFEEWATVLTKIADFLTAVIGGRSRDGDEPSVSNVEQRQRARLALQRLKSVLDQVPSLKQQVLQQAQQSKSAYAALL